MSKHHCHSCCNSQCDCCCHESHHPACGHTCHGGAASCNEHAHHNSCDYPEYFLEVADEAWIEVLKEKIKDHIRKNDPKIDEVARIVAEANKEKWKAKMSKNKCCENYAHQLMQCFESCCSDSSCSTSKK